MKTTISEVLQNTIARTKRQAIQLKRIAEMQYTKDYYQFQNLREKFKTQFEFDPIDCADFDKFYKDLNENGFMTKKDSKDVFDYFQECVQNGYCVNKPTRVLFTQSELDPPGDLPMFVQDLDYLTGGQYVDPSTEPKEKRLISEGR
jgi:hypothetical protein